LKPSTCWVNCALQACSRVTTWGLLLHIVQGKIINDGLLSRLQLEGVLYAGQRHQSILPDGKRAGFFIADGAGVGKGRQLSGIVLDNFSRGRTKHVWISISGDLRFDAERDLKDIGCHVNVVDGCKGLDAQKSSSTSTGVLFVTYSTLISSGSGEKDIASTIILTPSSHSYS
jgi:P-loop containing NTP hydrolase pore-1